MIKRPISGQSLALWLCLFAAFVLGGCDNSPSPAPSRPGLKPRPVDIVTVTTRKLGIQQTLTGTLSAERHVRLHNQEAGQIERLPFYEGDSVMQGEILATLDDRLLEAEIAQAQARLRQARVDQHRTDRLSKSNLASEDELAQAQTELDVADSEVQLLKTRLEYTRLKAPFTGIVTHRLVEPGDAVPAYTHLLSLADLSSLIIELKVPESLLAQLSTGAGVDVRIDALGSSRYPGSLSRIHPTIDPETRQGIVEVRLNPLPPGVRPGQFARVYFTRQPSPRRVIPLSALQQDKQGKYVYRIDQQVVHRQSIRTGAIIDRWIEVLQGLKDGDKVVSRGFLGLSDGSPVTIQDSGSIHD